MTPDGDRPVRGLSVRKPDGSTHVLYQPHAAQQAFHTCPAINVVAIGSRGSGKSTALRMDAHMRALLVPNANMVLVRKTRTELFKTHVAEIQREMPLLGGWYSATHHTAFYPNGSRLFLMYVSQEALNLLSADLVAAYFDELSTIPWEFFLRMSASVRVRRGSGLTAVVRAATNPFGPSAREILRYFVNKDVSPDDDPDYDPTDWDSVRMDLKDNPHVDHDQYLKRFVGLPSYLRKAWVDGEFVLERQLFDFRPTKQGRPYHVIDQVPCWQGQPVIERTHLDGPWIVRGPVQVYRALDLGYYPDPTYCLWIAHLGNRYLVFHERAWYRTVIEDIAEQIKRESEGLPIVTTFADPSMALHSTASIQTPRDRFESCGIPLELSVNNREYFAFAIHSALSVEVEPGVPKLQIVGPACPMLTRALPLQQYDAKRPGRLADRPGDDPVVALAYFLISSGALNRMAPESPKVVPRWMRPKTPSRLDQWGLAHVR